MRGLLALYCSPAKAGVQIRRRTGPRLPPGITLACFALALGKPAFADSNLPPAHYANVQLENPQQEAKAIALMETLRCLVCQGQSIADSDAEIAGDMRAFVRESIRQGQSPEQIRKWLMERYGAWISYKPPVEPLTWPLWAAPLVLLLVGAWLARGRFKRRRA